MPDEFIEFLEQEYRKTQTDKLTQRYLQERGSNAEPKKGIPELLLEADKLLRRK